ncbi:MAG: Three-deoxy-D-manno-octulosonic-acid transferase domain protein [Chthoniobacteraceae bacterium]|nr:Three-deoxy-D-manno-octulosonic-acid transferase domain protein [Chthoniobacteraceae bacterium]
MPPVSLPFAARRSLFVYNCFFPIVFAVLLPGFARRMLRRGNFRDKFGQRFGLYKEADRELLERGGWTWIHSISVGETLVALKLARELYRQDRSVRVVLSVTTSTGFAVALQVREEWLVVLYNPLDLRSITSEALDTLRPDRVVFIEGEAWPNLVAECRRRGIPTALVNARLSPRSERRFRRFRTWSGPIFALLDQICVPEQDDIARWISLGAAPESLHHTGSLKFDIPDSVFLTRAPEFRALLAPLGVTDLTPILVAGSTWEPEEETILKIFAELRREIPDLFLILVPRHVERVPSLHASRMGAPASLRLQRRTALPLPNAEPCDVLLVDTTGELRDWYALATVVFVGKSLPGISDTGGQNPAEPAALGKPVVFGPHMENFAPVVQLLLDRDAAVQVSNPVDLEVQLRSLLLDPARRERLQTSAIAALSVHRGSLERTAALLLSR